MESDWRQGLESDVQGVANLLGGRALRYELRVLTSGELGGGFDLDRALNHGYLPTMYEAERPRRLLNACVSDYLMEETAARRRIVVCREPRPRRAGDGIDILPAETFARRLWAGRIDSI